VPPRPADAHHAAYLPQAAVSFARSPLQALSGAGKGDGKNE
jgi:hypothetical protein